MPAAHHAPARGTDARPPTQKLASLQALRALAAFGVVACHLIGFERNYVAGPDVTPAAFQYGMVGVDLYFVISGFIITLMCKGRFRRQGEAPRFLWRRFIRVYPIFLIWCLAVFAVFVLHPGMVNSSHGRPDIVRSFLLLPQRNLPLLLVSWTLVFEAFFYVLFAGALRWLREENLPRCLLGWAAVVVAGNLLLQPTRMQPWLHLVFSPLQVEFMFGCVIALYVDRIRPAAAWGSVAVGLAGLALGMLVLSRLADPYPLGWGRSLVFGTASGLLLAGVVALERHGQQWFPRPLVALGDSSYSLYLSHIPVLGAVGLVWRHFAVAASSPLAHVAVLVITFALAVCGGIVSYLMLEVPMLQAMRRWNGPTFAFTSARREVRQWLGSR